MKFLRTILPAAVCALFLAGAHAQSAGSALKSASLPMFQYDAQHDQVLASGITIKPSSAASPTIPPTTGTLVVTVNITAISHFVKGTTYHCSLTAIGGMLDLSNGLLAGGIETASNLAKWDGTKTLSCTLTIPYSWTLPPDPSATRGALLAFGVSAVAPSSDGGMVQRSTLQVDGIEPIPPNGDTSTLAFNVTL